jgi:phosphate transport system protein
MLMQTFEGELQRLQDEMLVLSSMVESAITESVDVLKRRDLAGSQHLIVLRQRIKKKRFAIEMDCVSLIITWQSLDGDLRTVTSILEIATELERIGDYATEVAMSPFMVIIEGSLPNLLVDIQRMAAKTQNMLQRALQAFALRDLAMAQAVRAENDEVDALYHQVYQDSLAFMKENSRVKGNSRALINQARYLAQIARNEECIADQVVHICDWVTFAVTGEMRNRDAKRVSNSSPSNPGNKRRGNARGL